MKEQNFKNHAQMVPGFHGVTFILLIALLIGSFVNLFTSTHETLYSASLISLIAVILVLIAWYLRAFALKAQDRAIRAEENLRYFVRTGKLFPASLRLGQIIALRFASDEEFLDLVEKAVQEKMDPKDIKKAIKNWRADWHRA